jgi:hypothetical protein
MYKSIIVPDRGQVPRPRATADDGEAQVTIATVWLLAGALYAAFLAWYVGWPRRMTPAEVDAACASVRDFDPAREPLLRRILEQDTGREFHMVNLIRLHRQLPSGASARELLMKYQKPFFAELLRRGGHPIALVRAAAPAIECWGLAGAEDWDAAVLVRYRSRRDLAAIIATPMFRSQHPFKVEAVAKTFAFVGDPATIIGGGPKVVVPLLLLAVAGIASALLG